MITFNCGIGNFEHKKKRGGGQAYDVHLLAGLHVLEVRSSYIAKKNKKKQQLTNKRMHLLHMFLYFVVSGWIERALARGAFARFCNIHGKWNTVIVHWANLLEMDLYWWGNNVWTHNVVQVKLEMGYDDLHKTGQLSHILPLLLKDICTIINIYISMGNDIWTHNDVQVNLETGQLSRFIISIYLSMGNDMDSRWCP